jgi:hypothetical protein
VSGGGEVGVDYVPWGLLALAAIVIGGVSILAVPPLGLLGIAWLVFLVWQHVTGDDTPEPPDDHDDPTGRAGS